MMKDGELKVGDLVRFFEGDLISRRALANRYPNGTPACGIVIHVPGQDDGPEIVRVLWCSGGSLWSVGSRKLERVIKSENNND